MSEIKVNKKDLLGRYDAVFHMTSVAVDLPKKYENISNDMRRENAIESIEIDKKLLDIWSEHPCRYIIDNSTGLNEKINRVFLNMSNFIEREIGDNIR